MYNGWHNWETWVVNLHFGDGLDEVLFAESEHELALEYKEFVESFVSEHTSVNKNEFVSELVFGALSEVNWWELARHVMDERDGQDR